MTMNQTNAFAIIGKKRMASCVMIFVRRARFMTLPSKSALHVLRISSLPTMSASLNAVVNN